MRYLLTILLIAATLNMNAQTLRELQPELSRLVDKSKEGEKKYNDDLKKYYELVEKYGYGFTVDTLTDKEKEFYKNSTYVEDGEGYWDVLGPGCSWYCGGGLDTQTASSYLKGTKNISYIPKNMHDLNYETAWVEGVDGYGVGESVTYHFPPESPRITSLIVVNGYVKSEKTWKENSRVKKLKMYISDVPYVILNLEDTRKEQIFNVAPLGYGDRKDWDKLKAKPWWSIKFEIMEVYEGDKYDETAITEIYFDGVDVH